MRGSGVVRAPPGERRARSTRRMWFPASFWQHDAREREGERDGRGAGKLDSLPEMSTVRNPWNRRCPGNMDQRCSVCVCGLVFPRRFSAAPLQWSGPGCRVGDAATRETLWFRRDVLAAVAWTEISNPVTRGIGVQRDPTNKASPPVTRKSGKPTDLVSLLRLQRPRIQCLTDVGS